MFLSSYWLWCATFYLLTLQEVVVLLFAPLCRISVLSHMLLIFSDMNTQWRMYIMYKHIIKIQLIWGAKDIFLHELHLLLHLPEWNILCSAVSLVSALYYYQVSLFFSAYNMIYKWLKVDLYEMFGFYSGWISEFLHRIVRSKELQL